ncbi:RHS repeat domain-containing protein [Andreprevotia sp. IGB-42]|uniref:RHS repeat domain-containing protein n=1 Tax=Andreprevotia sp. IGB-42 TaxID=2497473 RepID=UPI00191DFC6B|nr:RHS repeat-associated core domain-containing protein [Andreprevotia sp. IGB-42]
MWADQLGTPRQITDPASNAVVWRWDSEAFGNTQANQDPGNTGNQFVYNLRFPGQYYDAESGRHYNYFRDYDPSTGRYVQSDPIGLKGGSFSTYSYVSGNPIQMLDFYGLDQNLFSPVRDPTQYAGAQADMDPTDGVLKIYAHGDADKVQGNYRCPIARPEKCPARLLDEYDPKKLADLIRSDPEYKDAKEVQILACHVGEKDYL